MKYLIVFSLMAGAGFSQTSNINNKISSFKNNLRSFQRLIDQKKIAITGKQRFQDALNDSIQRIEEVRQQTLEPILSLAPDVPIDIRLKGSQKLQYVFSLFRECDLNFRSIGSANFNFQVINSRNRVVLNRNVSTLNENITLPADRYRVLFTNRSSSSSTFSFVAGIVPDPIDPIDPIDPPGNFLEIGDSKSASLKSGARDSYSLKVRSQKTVEIYTSSSIDTYLEIYDSNGSRIASDDDSGSGRNALVRRSFSAGTYEVIVRGYSSSTSGSYSINVR